MSEKRLGRCSNRTTMDVSHGELGELASAIRRSTNKFNDRKKTNIEGEIMDVLTYFK